MHIVQIAGKKVPMFCFGSQIEIQQVQLKVNRYAGFGPSDACLNM